MARPSNPAGKFVQLSLGMEHSCGVTDGGIIECWGDNSYGQSATYPRLYLPVINK